MAKDDDESSDSLGFWPRETVYFVLVGLLLITILILTLINRWYSRREPVVTENVEAVVRRSDNTAEAPVRRRLPDGAVREDIPVGARRRLARRRMQLEIDSYDEAPTATGREQDQDGEDSEEDALDNIALPDGKVGTKKLRKLQEKAEKRAMRTQMEQERVEKKERMEAQEKKLKKEQERQKLLDAEMAEELRKKKEEEERMEHEEYLKLKAEFTVDEEGEQDDTLDLNSESLLQEFINYIKEIKVVMLEDLAVHFSIKTQDAINRVQDLLNDGTLTGVMDDRGKFIYITMPELESVAKYIQQRGRVSITDLAESSNTLINLNPDNELAQRRLLGEVSV